MTTNSENNNFILCDYKRATKFLPQYWAAFIATIGAFSIGTFISWTSYTLPLLSKENIKFNITHEEGSWLGSLLLLGALFGSMIGGSVASHIGPRRTLQLTAFPLFTAWIIIAYCNTIYGFYIARIIGGFAIGMISVAAPTYIAELAEAKLRGRLTSFFQLQITLGLLFGYILGGLLEDIIVLALIPAIIPLIYLIMLSSVPESPLFLARKGEWGQVKVSVQWFRGKMHDIDNEVSKIHQFTQMTNNQLKVNDLLNGRATIRALLLSSGLMIFQQLSGINAVLFYTENIFRDSGCLFAPSTCAIIIGTVQVVATYVSTLLIDRIGRRILLLISSSVMSICLMILGWYFYFKQHYNIEDFTYIPLLTLAIYIVVFSIGFGPIPWIIMSEIFNSNVKGVAGSISATINWFLAFIVTKFFSNLLDSVGNFITFSIFSTICIFATIFVYCFLPETKGKQIDEIIIELEKK